MKAIANAPPEIRAKSTSGRLLAALKVSSSPIESAVLAGDDAGAHEGQHFVEPEEEPDQQGGARQEGEFFHD